MNDPTPVSNEDSTLLDQLFKSDEAHFLNSMSDKTKERLIKDGLIKGAMEFVQAMNDTFHDVLFKISWIRMHPFQDYTRRQYDKAWIDDDDYMDIEYDYDLEAYYELPLDELGLEIQYTWQRTCSLDHVHNQKRFHLFSSPQWLTMLSHWRLKPDVKDFTRQYIKDFFYEF